MSDSKVVAAAVAAEYNLLRGRCLGLIESWGLQPSQENGCKAIFKSLTYDSQARILALLEQDPAPLP